MDKHTHTPAEILSCDDDFLCMTEPARELSRRYIITILDNHSVFHGPAHTLSLVVTRPAYNYSGAVQLAMHCGIFFGGVNCSGSDRLVLALVLAVVVAVAVAVAGAGGMLRI